jgi:hypothetical protein
MVRLLAIGLPMVELLVFAGDLDLSWSPAGGGGVLVKLSWRASRICRLVKLSWQASRICRLGPSLAGPMGVGVIVADSRSGVEAGEPDLPAILL